MNKVVLAASFVLVIVSCSDDYGRDEDKVETCLPEATTGSEKDKGDYKIVCGGKTISYGYNDYNDIDLRLSSSSRYSSSSVGNVSGTFNDNRNNETYKWVRIGNQVWMARNLNYRVNESNIVIGTCYNNSATNCDKYGRLYTWATAMALPSSCNSSTCSGRINTKHQGICPSGWHIPSDDEWDELEYYVGSSMAGWHLKATSGWGSYDDGGGDTYGFSALPGGSGDNSANKYYKAGESGHWWSYSEADSKNAHSRALGYNTDRFYSNDIEDKTLPFSIRCVKD